MSRRYDPGPDGGGRPVILALHCSGSSGRQWRMLGDMAAGRAELLAPDLLGTPAAGQWTGEHAFTLADEAATVLALIDAEERPVHLVGHSYGGGLALHVAARRPHRLASLTLYEPSAFHLLKIMGAAAGPGYLEIVTVAAEVADGLSTGAYEGAAALFVDYWNGTGTWAAMKPEHRAELLRYLPKAVLDFRALLHEPAQAGAYGRITSPVLLMRGELAPEPTRQIADGLPSLFPAADLRIIEGAGHMGPITHRDAVNAAILDHVLRAGERGQSEGALARAA